MPASVSQKIQTGLGAVMLAVGASALVWPSRFVNSPEPSPSPGDREYLTRMWALREAAIGAILLGTSRSGQRRSVLVSTVVLSAAESAVILQTPTLRGKDRLTGAASAAAFGALSAYALRDA
ncbi:MAG: hypothetical protein ABWY45_18455 [Mycobacterium sp.]